MSVRAAGEGYRTTMVCVDSYMGRVMKGRFYNPYLAEGKSFIGLTQFLLEMEKMLDTMDFPKPFAAIRTFAPPPETEGIPPDNDLPFGNRATFVLRVLFRQNASWQGSITWREGKQEQSFRSVLELILLMDSALSNQLEE